MTTTTRTNNSFRFQITAKVTLPLFSKNDHITVLDQHGIERSGIIISTDSVHLFGGQYITIRLDVPFETNYNSEILETRTISLRIHSDNWNGYVK